MARDQKRIEALRSKSSRKPRQVLSPITSSSSQWSPSPELKKKAKKSRSTSGSSKLKKPPLSARKKVEKGKEATIQGKEDDVDQLKKEAATNFKLSKKSTKLIESAARESIAQIDAMEALCMEKVDKITEALQNEIKQGIEMIDKMLQEWELANDQRKTEVEAAAAQCDEAVKDVEAKIKEAEEIVGQNIASFDKEMEKLGRVFRQRLSTANGKQTKPDQHTNPATNRKQQTAKVAKPSSKKMPAGRRRRAA